jgi:hypothetical protein
VNEDATSCQRSFIGTLFNGLLATFQREKSC